MPSPGRNPCPSAQRPPATDRLSLTPFLTRAVTAAVMLAAFVSAFWLLERGIFAMVVAAIAAIGGYEWASLNKSGRTMSMAYGLLCALLVAGLAQFPWIAPWACWIAALFWLLAAPLWLARGFNACPPSLIPAAGVVVLVPAALAMAALGRGQVLMLLGLVWIADIAAYLAGRTFGKHKLAPVISPGKTWEGFAGAVGATIIYAIIWAQFDPELAARVHGAAWVPYLAAALLLLAVSVIGDLLESAVKRRAGAKDSGRLLPGHGGILDRIDSATAALPVALLLMQLTGTT